MKVGTILYTLGLYTLVAVPTFILTAKSMDVDIANTFEMIASGTIPEQPVDQDEIQQRIENSDDYMYISQTQQSLETIAPASGEEEEIVDENLVQKMLETEARNQEAFEQIFDNK